MKCNLKVTNDEERVLGKKKKFKIVFHFIWAVDLTNSQY